MKYAFFGSPEFAAIILERLIAAGMQPALVVCNPDRPIGRKKIVTPPPTKVIAERHGIAVFQPESLRPTNLWKSDFQRLVGKSWDFFIVAAYAQIIPRAVLDLPKFGVIGVHPSLLPEYRGATPIQSVILNGESETGVTLYLMDKEVDHGKILVTSHWSLVIGATYETLMRELASVSANLLVETLPKFVDGKILPQEQDHAAATFTKKFVTEDGFVDLAKDDPVIIDRKVRALNPDPGVYTFVDCRGKKIRMKILETTIVDGKLVLVTTQLEGKKPIRA